MDFEATYEAFKDQIARLSCVQRIPEMEPEDVENEMTVMLWKAVDTHDDAKGPFGTYWWSLWLNRRSDLSKSYYAVKRVHGLPTGTVPDQSYAQKVFPLPPKTDALGRRVWGAIANGDTTAEVRRDQELSRRRFYQLIHSWRTEEIRRMLKS